jgi:hypothetical protein
MMRVLLSTVAFAFVAVPLVAQNKEDEKKPTVDLFASLDDRDLQKSMPESGVIATANAWEKLAKAWGIKDPAKVDFEKEILVVATTVGSRMNISTKLDEKGDLQIIAISTRDLRPGFRYAIKSISRDGVKTVKGLPLPKE